MHQVHHAPDVQVLRRAHDLVDVQLVQFAEKRPAHRLDATVVPRGRSCEHLNDVGMIGVGQGDETDVLCCRKIDTVLAGDDVVAIA